MSILSELDKNCTKYAFRGRAWEKIGGEVADEG
jgi:hypothetical protein